MDTPHPFTTSPTPVNTAITARTHLPSARKFRPKFFSQVKGQETISKALQSAIASEKLPNAYLFSGLRGCGKTTFARLIAAALNCSHKTASAEPCNSCSSCHEMWSGQSLNCIEIDGASNRGIDDIRRLQENVSLRASGGGYKVYIIDEVHMLTKEAFNALLKTLEEPPESVLFIFATTEPHKVPDTVLSRCQCFALRHMSEQVITQHLQQIAQELNVESSQECLALIANAAQGSMRDSLSIFDQALAFHQEIKDPQKIFDLLHLPSPTLLANIDQAILNSDIKNLLSQATTVCQQGTNMESWFDQLLAHYRNHLLVSYTQKSLTNLPTKQQAELYQTPLFATNDCLEFLDIVSGARKTVSGQTHLQLHLELTLLALLRYFQQEHGTSYKQAHSYPSTEPTAVHESIEASSVVLDNPIDLDEKQQSIPSPSPIPSLVEQQKISTTAPTAQKSRSKDQFPSTESTRSTKADLQAPKKPEKTAPPILNAKQATSPSTTQDTAKAKAKEAQTPKLEKVPKARYDTILQFAAREIGAQIEEV